MRAKKGDMSTKVYAVDLSCGKGNMHGSQMHLRLFMKFYIKPTINHVVDELKKLDIAETVVVVGHGADQVKALLDNDYCLTGRAERLWTCCHDGRKCSRDKEGITLVLKW